MKIWFEFIGLEEFFQAIAMKDNLRNYGILAIPDYADTMREFMLCYVSQYQPNIIEDMIIEGYTEYEN